MMMMVMVMVMTMCVCVCAQEDDGLGGKLAVFREGAGKCLSTAINRTTDQVVREGEREREREREREAYTRGR